MPLLLELLRHALYCPVCHVPVQLLRPDCCWATKKKVLHNFPLLVIIPILGESFLELISGDLFASTGSGLALSSLLIGVITAFVSGYIACKWMLKLVKNGKLIWFALYCTIIGLLALILPLV